MLGSAGVFDGKGYQHIGQWDEITKFPYLLSDVPCYYYSNNLTLLKHHATVLEKE